MVIQSDSTGASGEQIAQAFAELVTRVLDDGKVSGFPLVPLQDNIKMRAALLHMPDGRKQLNKLMKNVFPDSPPTNSPE